MSQPLFAGRERAGYPRSFSPAKDGAGSTNANNAENSMPNKFFLINPRQDVSLADCESLKLIEHAS
jgi:hypothetical protein